VWRSRRRRHFQHAGFGDAIQLDWGADRGISREFPNNGSQEEEIGNDPRVSQSGEVATISMLQQFYFIISLYLAHPRDTIIIVRIHTAHSLCCFYVCDISAKI